LLTTNILSHPNIVLSDEIILTRQDNCNVAQSAAAAVTYLRKLRQLVRIFIIIIIIIIIVGFTVRPFSMLSTDWTVPLKICEFLERIVSWPDTLPN